MVPIAAMVAMLKADDAITALVGDRVLDHDARRAGWESDPALFDPDGAIRPLLMVVDAGTVSLPYDGPAARADQVYVWAFAPRTPAGRAAVAALMERVAIRLFRWQDPATGAMASPAGRLGLVSDDQSVYDRLICKVAGILAVAEW